MPSKLSLWHNKHKEDYDITFFQRKNFSIGVFSVISEASSVHKQIICSGIQKNVQSYFFLALCREIGSGEWYSETRASGILKESMKSSKRFKTRAISSNVRNWISPICSKCLIVPTATPTSSDSSVWGILCFSVC